MNLEDPIGIIELGYENIICVIFKVTRDNDVQILSTSTATTFGFKNDVVTNLEKATHTIRSCISIAEKNAKVSLRKVNVVLEQPDFLCTKFSKHKNIDGSKIYKDDIDFLLKEAKKQLILNDQTQSIIHIFNHNYIVDNKTFIEEPINVYANTLSHEMTFITGPKNNFKNIKQAFAECDLEIERFFSKTFLLGVKLLNQKELESGFGLINFEHEKISLGLFKNLAIVHSITLPIGINHIIRDISKVCSLNMDESESIINKIDFSFENKTKLFDESNYLKNDFFSRSSYKKISKDLILNVVQARLNETLNLLKKQLIVPGFDLLSGANFLLEGEGSKLLNLEKYLISFFGINVKKKINENESLKNNFTASLGAIKIIVDGWETEALPEVDNKKMQREGFFSKVIKSLWKN